MRPEKEVTLFQNEKRAKGEVPMPALAWTRASIYPINGEFLETYVATHENINFIAVMRRNQSGQETRPRMVSCNLTSKWFTSAKEMWDFMF